MEPLLILLCQTRRNVLRIVQRTSKVSFVSLPEGTSFPVALSPSAIVDETRTKIESLQQKCSIVESGKLSLLFSVVQILANNHRFSGREKWQIWEIKSHN